MADLFFNRELSWIKFNERVLEEACRIETPLYERLKFVYIFASNLDEFYMVRIGSLLDQSLISGRVVDNKSQMTPAEQIHAVNKAVKELYPYRDNAYFTIMDSLSAFTCHHTNFRALNGGERRIVKTYFETQVLPLLSPQIIDAKHPFPHLENKRIYIGVRLKSKDTQLFGIIPLPNELDRIYMIPGSNAFLLLEDIVQHYAGSAFEIYEIEAKVVFRVTRNADLEFDENLFDEDTDYREYIREMLKKRGKLSPVRLEASSVSDEALCSFFLAKLGLTKRQCYHCQSPLDLSFVPRLEERFDPKIRERLFHTTLKPQWPSLLTHGNISRQIDKGDVLLSYPYDSMRPLNELVREASEDNRVLSIKMTLYRIGNQSQIVQNLCAAAESGKDVTVIIELRARFDEQNNINWASVMEESGCKVIYGIDDYKVHSKIILITRRAAHGLEYIVNIATGNYNESTTRLYADLSLCMTDPVICDDAVRFFHNIEIGNIFGSYRRLLVSPSTLKQGIINMITEEIVKASDGKPARIVFKMNSLTDKEIIEKLIEASQAGVKISLIIRGICCLRPNVPDYTDNIEIISIVGRFLEHARVYCFGEGVGAKLYIGSADMMTRNTEHRIEILAPVDDLKLKARIMDMLETQLKDNVKSRILNANGNYTPVQTDGEQIDSQMLFYEQAYRLAEMATLQQKVIKPSRAPVKQLRGLRNRLVNIRKSRIPKV